MKQENKLCTIITTVHHFKNTSVSDFLKKHTKVIVVGDNKTNHKSFSDHKSIEYIHPHENNFKKLSSLLPYNHYSRKNLGYLYAIKNRFHNIVDCDDDTFLTGDIEEWKSYKHRVVISPSAPNILKKFTDKNMWLRGYPLEYVKNSKKIGLRDCSTTDINNIGIIQSLTTGEPDVDAVSRLTAMQTDINFTPNRCYIFNKDVYTQGNTQSTIWINPKLFHLLYIPSTVSFRFCDILKMYIAQRCMWEYGLQFATASPFFQHNRNKHNLMNDFVEEVPMYVNVKKLIDTILPKVKLRGEVDDILYIYEELHKHDMVALKEIKLLDTFLQEL